MKKLTRRDFLVGLRNLGIGVGILPLVKEFPWKDPEPTPEILKEATEQLLYSSCNSITSCSGDAFTQLLEGIEIKRHVP